jgi:flavin-dependent dehydrogenase
VTRVSDPCDVVVVGAGPAGSTAAQLLASWGWSVTLVHHAGVRPALAESLPSSTRKLLAFLGQLSAVECAGFHPSEGNAGRWAGAARETGTADAGFHVSRSTFDAVLREGARHARARIVDAIVQRVQPGEPVLVTCGTVDGRQTTFATRFVLDCSGRSGIVARRGLRRATAPYRTLAIAAEWECPSWPAAEGTKTVIDSGPDGWAWSVPLSNMRRQCTVMIEPKPQSDLQAPHTLQSIYLRELERFRELRQRLGADRQTSAPWACDASIYDSVRAADDHLLLVGDAASFIEPLSSAGVKKALLSAWRAAVVVNTCLTNPALATAANDLFIAREREVFAECMRRSRAFFAEAAAVYDSSFWTRRAAHRAEAAPASSDGGDHLSEEALASDVDVRLAFDRLRGADRLRLRPSAALRFARTASIEGREVVMREAVVVAGIDGPLQFAAGVDVAALARLATVCDEVPALIAAYHTQVGPVALRGLLTGLSFLVARHALVAEVSPS